MLKPRTARSSGDEVSAADRQGGCCGGPAPEQVEACCAMDAEAKAEGRDGCGCGNAIERREEATESAGCCGNAG